MPVPWVCVSISCIMIEDEDDDIEIMMDDFSEEDDYWSQFKRDVLNILTPRSSSRYVSSWHTNHGRLRERFQQIRGGVAGGVSNMKRVLSTTKIVDKTKVNEMIAAHKQSFMLYLKKETTIRALDRLCFFFSVMGLFAAEFILLCYPHWMFSYFLMWLIPVRIL